MAAFWAVLVCFFSDRTIAFFLPCWPDYRRFAAAVCANFQIQISHFKLKIRGAGEGDGDGDGSGMGWVGGRLDSRVFANVAKTMCAAFCNYVIAAAVCEIGFCT